MAKLYAKSPSGEDALLSISITGFTQSLQQNGWCKLPNGLLIQWFETPEYGNSTYTTPFLISFNNHCAWIKSYLRHLDIIFEFGIIPSKTSFGIKISELNKSLTLWIYAIGY